MFDVNKGIITFIIIISFILVCFAFHDSVSAFEDSILKAIRKAEEKAQQQRLEAQSKAKAVESFYKKGKVYYGKGKYAEAISNFKQLLEIHPNYEPAKLYLECAVIQQKVLAESEKANSLKTKMADTIAEYDAKIEHAKGLTYTYMLKQALLKCQAGDFDGADYYYNLCYKLDPNSKESLEWFVNATYDLRDLSSELDEVYRTIDEIPELESEDLEPVS